MGIYVEDETVDADGVFEVLLGLQHAGILIPSDAGFGESLGADHGLPVDMGARDRGWTARFDFRGKTKTLKFDELFDWKDSEDPFVKYYSGTAVYATTFAAEKEEGKRYFLSFGNILNIAEIFVNGKSCGTLWTPPYRIDVTDALARGENTLEIHVANTWANHIKGVHEKQVPSTDFWTLVPYWPDVPLQGSGIIGPVTLGCLTSL